MSDPTVLAVGPLYVIGERDGHRFISCARCGLASFNPNDIVQRYCPRCHVFHDDPTPLPLPTVLEAAEALLEQIPDRPWPGRAGPAIDALRAAVARARASQ